MIASVIMREQAQKLGANSHTIWKLLAEMNLYRRINFIVKIPNISNAYYPCFWDFALTIDSVVRKFDEKFHSPKKAKSSFEMDLQSSRIILFSLNFEISTWIDHENDPEVGDLSSIMIHWDGLALMTQIHSHTFNFRGKKKVHSLRFVCSLNRLCSIRYYRNIVVM